MIHRNRLTSFASSSVVALFVLTLTTACHVSTAPQSGSANQPAVKTAPVTNQPATKHSEFARFRENKAALGFSWDVRLQ